MANKSEEKNKIYRLTLLDDSSHKRIKSYRFTRLGITIILVSALIVVGTLIFSVIAFTPVRTLIPGYPDARSKRQAIENAIRIDSLENVIIRWELYSENLARVLTGEQTISLDSIVKENTTKYLKNITQEQIAGQDSLLRKKVKEK